MIKQKLTYKKAPRKQGAFFIVISHVSKHEAVASGEHIELLMNVNFVRI
jgi:hypothetical protein